MVGRPKISAAIVTTVGSSGRLGSCRCGPRATFRQPLITYDENQLVIAEASLQSGDAAGAALALKNVRDRYGKSVIAAPTLNDIMT